MPSLWPRWISGNGRVKHEQGTGTKIFLPWGEQPGKSHWPAVIGALSLLSLPLWHWLGSRAFYTVSLLSPFPLAFHHKHWKIFIYHFTCHFSIHLPSPSSFAVTHSLGFRTLDTHSSYPSVFTPLPLPSPALQWNHSLPFKKILIWLHWVLVAACGIADFSLVTARRLSGCSTQALLPRGMWDLSSPTRDWTHVPCTGRWILND